MSTAFWLIVVVALLAVVVWAMARQRDVIWPGEVGLLYDRGRFVRELGAGPHTRIDLLGHTKVKRVSTLPLALQQQIAEVISKDQFSFRVALAPMASVTDPRAYWEENKTPDWMQMAGHGQTIPQLPPQFERVHSTLAAATLQAIGKVTLEEFLADPAAALTDVGPQVDAVMPGARLEGILVTAITLPPETRKMFTEIERARREGLAALERARAEQASLRALANAARNLADNPELAKLRMLQVMENARGSKTFVFGDPNSARIGETDN